MPLTRTITGVSDDTQKPFEDIEHISNVSNVSSSRSAVKTSKEVVNEVDLVDGVTVNENYITLVTYPIGK